MYSKSLSHATYCVALLFAVACSSAKPWADEPTGEEINLAFVIRNNLVYLSSATIDGRAGRFLFASAEPHSILDSRFAETLQGPTHMLQLNARQSLRFNPVVFDLGGIGDGMVGSDVWGNHAVTIDYRAGLLTFQRSGIHPELMSIYRYADQPMINVVVDGRTVPAVVDTASPDTLVLPRGEEKADRRSAHVQIAGIDFAEVDVRLADITTPRVGNRLLSKFLVSIDYGRRQIGLWRDPRAGL